MSPHQSTDESRLLAERVKELDCLYAISRLFDRRDACLDDVLTATLSRLCAAWQYPEAARARIALEGREYNAGRAEPAVAAQACPIIASGAIAGSLEVAYVERRPPSDEGPFLDEERQLLNVVAQRLGEFVERRRAEERLLAYQEKLRSLSAELSLSEERERRRIAQALHDRIGQVLALVNIKLGAALETAAGHHVARELLDVRRLVGEIIADTRHLTFDLSPPVLYELGFEAALEWLAESVGREYGLRVECRFPRRRVPLDEVLRVVLFQCVRELVANACSHSRAQVVHVTVTRTRTTTVVTVADDGVGMDPTRLSRRGDGEGFGLFSIQERISDLGGRVSISSEPGRGVSVELLVPRSRPRRKHRRVKP